MTIGSFRKAADNQYAFISMFFEFTDAYLFPAWITLKI